EWNHFTVTCEGQKITVVLNGETVNECDMSRFTDAKKNPGWLATTIPSSAARAIETVLDAYATVLAGNPGNPRRHRIEHGGAMYPPMIARAAELGIVVASQPG